MLKRTFSIALLIAGLCAAQSRQCEHPVRQAVRGTHGAVAAGSEYATEAGMRMFYKGGNAVDVGVAAMFAASVTEFSHFGMGGEAPILIRTKAGKVYSIAGVGPMPKSATAEMFRTRPLKIGRDSRDGSRRIEGHHPGGRNHARAGSGNGGRWVWWRCASSAPNRSAR